MDFASRFPTKESSHFPINEPHDLAIVNDAIRLGEVVMHKAHIQVGISIREKNRAF
jgi:hypothetical protein